MRAIALADLRALSKDAILQAAIALMEGAGEAGFSVRELGRRVGCDPMAILYHFRNKDGLLRAMADALTARLVPVGEDRPWEDRLRALARQYRALALGHPNTFGLMRRFLHTGVADFPHIEMVHGALGDAGVAEDAVPAICLVWYAGIIGLCMGEIGGLIRPAREADAMEIEKLPPEAYPLLRRSVPVYRALRVDKVFEIANDILLDGIRAQAAG